jgi:gliding motility-associated-like protein
MRKSICLFLCVLFTSLTLSSQNMKVTIGKANVNIGQSAEVDVTVSNFNNVLGGQFSIKWDSTKFKFEGSSNEISNSVLIDGNLDIGAPGPNSKIKQGIITILWGAGEKPVSLPNGTRLITLKFKAFGVACDSTDLVLSDTPLKSEYYDKDLNPFKTAFDKGTLKINGTGCTNSGGGGGGGGSTGLVFKAGEVNALPGSIACVPFTVENFRAIEALQAVISWNPAVLRMRQPVAFDIFPGNLYNTAAVNIGKLNFLWSEPSGGFVSHPNGTKVIEICFDVLGAAGTSSVIDISTKTDETLFVDTSGAEIKYTAIDGKVNVSAANSLELNIGKVNVNANGEVNVPFVVNNFNSIQSGSFAVSYDPSILEFVNRNGDIEPGSGSSQLVSPGRLNYNYLTQKSGGSTLANGSVLFNLRFKALPCTGANKVANITVADQSNLAVEFVNSTVQKVPYKIEQGVVTVNCGTVVADCIATISGTTNVSCRGGSNGAVNVAVTNTTGTCTASWKKNGVAFGASVPVANASLTGLTAGVYLLEVTCDGKISCTATATVTEPAAINIAETVTNLGCANATGAIQLVVTGGTVGGGYTYLWSNQATTKDISGIAAGTFSVVVTDGNSCTSSKSFTVTNAANTSPVATATGTNVSCNGAKNGSIAVTVAGGCAPYKYAWASSTSTDPNRTALEPGTYNVTVSDASSPAKTTTAQVVITEPAAISLEGATTASSGTNGAIVLTATGGNGGFTFNWGNNVTTKDRSGLATGNFAVTVTDSKGCTSSKSFTVAASGGTLSLGSVVVASNNKNNGFGVSCVNLCDAEITGNVVGGVAPFTVSLSGVSTSSATLQQAGSFSFKGLCVGNYSIRVTDGAANTSLQAITVTSPTAITITETVKCATGAIPSGSIDLTVIGGSQPYTFAWSNNEKTEDLRLLPVGVYSIVISDANGCQSVAKAIRVDDCTLGNECFEDYTTIMTPNSDGFNDLFNITCATDFQNELLVYDRWGKLVYSTKNYGNSWDGKDSNDVQLPEGGYMWVMSVTYKDGSRQTFKGTVTILR